MKWMLTLVASVVVGQGTALAERAATPADATVFIRLVGSVHAEIEEAGAAKQIGRSGSHRNRDRQRLRDFASRLRAHQRARDQQQRVRRHRRTP